MVVVWLVVIQILVEPEGYSVMVVIAPDGAFQILVEGWCDMSVGRPSSNSDFICGIV